LPTKLIRKKNLIFNLQLQNKITKIIQPSKSDKIGLMVVSKMIFIL